MSDNKPDKVPTQTPPSTAATPHSEPGRPEANEINYGNVDFTKVQGAGRFYGNHIAGSSSLFDIRLIFSDVDIVNQRVVANQVLTVLMAPELAFLTHKLLGELLERYQRMNGKLRIPEGAKLQNLQTQEKPEEKKL